MLASGPAELLARLKKALKERSVRDAVHVWVKRRAPATERSSEPGKLKASAA